MRPVLKAPGTKRLKLKCYKQLSSFAFSFNLRRYKKAVDHISGMPPPPAAVAAPGAGGGVVARTSSLERVGGAVASCLERLYWDGLHTTARGVIENKHSTDVQSTTRARACV